MFIAASLSLLIIFTFMFGIGLHEIFDIYLGNPFWPEIDIMHAGISVWQTVFLFDQLVRVTHVCTILVLFVRCLCLRFGLGNDMAWF